MSHGTWMTRYLVVAFALLTVKEVDNTLTIIIASAVGGAIALLMGFMLLKNFTLFVMSKLEEKKYVLFVICFLHTVLQQPLWNVDLHIPWKWYKENIILIVILLTASLFHFCSKECLVTSSGIDNTENGLSGSKADSKPTPKKKWKQANKKQVYVCSSILETHFLFFTNSSTSTSFCISDKLKLWFSISSRLSLPRWCTFTCCTLLFMMLKRAHNFRAFMLNTPFFHQPYSVMYCLLLLWYNNSYVKNLLARFALFLMLRQAEVLSAFTCVSLIHNGLCSPALIFFPLLRSTLCPLLLNSDEWLIFFFCCV